MITLVFWQWSFLHYAQSSHTRYSIEEDRSVSSPNSSFFLSVPLLCCQPTYLPFCYGRSLKTNSCRETLVFTELIFYCCVLTGNGIHPLYNWEELFLWCIDWAAWYSSASDEFSLVLELLGWETPSLVLANSLFLACSFMPQAHWTVWVPSQSRENSALHSQDTWLNFGVPWLDKRVSYFFRRAEVPYSSWLLCATNPISGLSMVILQ